MRPARSGRLGTRLSAALALPPSQHPWRCQMSCSRVLPRCEGGARGLRGGWLSVGSATDYRRRLRIQGASSHAQIHCQRHDCSCGSPRDCVGSGSDRRRRVSRCAGRVCRRPRDVLPRLMTRPAPGRQSAASCDPHPRPRRDACPFCRGRAGRSLVVSAGLGAARRPDRRLDGIRRVSETARSPRVVPLRGVTLRRGQLLRTIGVARTGPDNVMPATHLAPGSGSRCVPCPAAGTAR